MVGIANDQLLQQSSLLCPTHQDQVRGTAKFCAAKLPRLPNYHLLGTAKFQYVALLNLMLRNYRCLHDAAKVASAKLPRTWHCQHSVRGTDTVDTAKPPLVALPNFHGSGTAKFPNQTWNCEVWHCRITVRGNAELSIVVLLTLALPNCRTLQ
jgi:hypothetical protein